MVGKELKRAMDRAGIDRAQLAAAIEVTPSAIGRWLNNVRRPRPDIAAKIEAVLGVDLGVDVVRLYYLEVPGKVARALAERYAGWSLRQAIEEEIRRM